MRIFLLGGVVLFLMFVSCADISKIEYLESELYRRDSMYKDLLVSNYGVPLTVNENYFGGTSLIDFDRLNADLYYSNSLSSYSLDSIIKQESNTKILPKYRPQKYSSLGPYRFFRFIVDMSNYGDRRIEMYDVDCEKVGSCILNKSIYSVDENCYGNNMQIPFHSSCYKIRSSENLELEKSTSASIFSIYTRSDLGRTAYYDHQSRLICDGMSIYLRDVRSGLDKLTVIHCPQEENPVIRILEVFEKIKF